MTNGHRSTLAENASASTGNPTQWPGGKGMFIAEATWGGGSAKLQMITPNGTFVDVTNVTLSANGAVAFEIPKGQIRTVIATATAAYVYAVSM